MSTADPDDGSSTAIDGEREPAGATGDDTDAAVRVEGLSKHYEGVKALDDVTLDVEANEVLALVGDNGAGKSTLIKCLAGVITPTAGEIYIREDGELREHVFEDSNDAQNAGIETVFQELSLSGQHDVASNVYMGREPIADGRLKGLFRHVDRDGMERGAVEALDEIGFQVDPRAKTAELSGGQQQAIAVARALISDPEIVLLDEPTAEVSVENSEQILELIGRLQDQGRTVVFISHNLEEVFEVADRIAVLRDGELVDVLDNDGTYGREHVVSLMTGAIVGSNVEDSRGEESATGEASNDDAATDDAVAENPTESE